MPSIPTARNFTTCASKEQMPRGYMEGRQPQRRLLESDGLHIDRPHRKRQQQEQAGSAIPSVRVDFRATDNDLLSKIGFVLLLRS